MVTFADIWSEPGIASNILRQRHLLEPVPSTTESLRDEYGCYVRLTLALFRLAPDYALLLEDPGHPVFQPTYGRWRC